MHAVQSSDSWVSNPWVKPILGGLGVGLLGLLFYFISPFWSSTGKPEVISVGGFLANTLAWGEKAVLTANHLLSGIPPIFRFLILGIVLGSFIDALWSRQLTWKGFKAQKILKDDLPYDVGGGVLIGFGVLLANGCVIKHLLSGVPGLDVASFVAVGGIIIGMWLGLKIVGG
ncbi:MAG: YeeE/YedE family protein [Deltaproteobacteria bacterium]|nr:YeeE/YedE family protein [Deltaproteobacteria bacterium]MBW2171048.1 YeeE/YedE family protein [Deltaproteobacteria bacterium]MBW2259405.1 YeeE/YedE family protein [Deltaproteobacteria bacterium]